MAFVGRRSPETGQPCLFKGGWVSGAKCVNRIGNKNDTAKDHNEDSKDFVKHRIVQQYACCTVGLCFECTVKGKMAAPKIGSIIETFEQQGNLFERETKPALARPRAMPVFHSSATNGGGSCGPHKHRQSSSAEVRGVGGTALPMAV